MAQDIFIPESSPDDALVEQLHTVTYVTSDKEAVEKLFRQGYGLNHTGWLEPSGAELGQLNDYFGFSDAAWKMCAFYKKGEGANVQVRVFYSPSSADQVRHEYNGFITGGATLSFPKPDLYEHEKQMKALGFDSTIGVKEMEFQSPTGEVYISAEIIYYAPENVYVMGVKRPDIFVPVGPMDPETGVGGGAYSARCVENADAVNQFLTDVLGFEVRRDVVFEIGEKSALMMPQGAKERFIQAFAPGSSTGYVVVMDHGDDNIPSKAASYGPPSRGFVMWSFRTKDIDAVFARAKAAGTEIMQPPTEMTSPFLANRRVLLLRDPSGFPIEIFQD